MTVVSSPKYFNFTATTICINMVSAHSTRTSCSHDLALPNRMSSISVAVVTGMAASADWYRPDTTYSSVPMVRLHVIRFVLTWPALCCLVPHTHE